MLLLIGIFFIHLLQILITKEMEDFKQNFLFPDMEKGSFSHEEFEKNILTDKLLFTIKNAFLQANERLETLDFADYKKRTIANVINDIVTSCIDKECRANMIGTIRNLYERDVLPIEKYLFIFKKSPVSNLETSFSASMANQEVPTHVITVAYNTDVFYNITSANIQYRSNNTVIYNKSLLLEKDSGFFLKTEVNTTREKAVPKLKVIKKEVAQ